MSYREEIELLIHQIEDKLADLGNEYDDAPDGSLRETEIEGEIDELETQWRSLNDRLDQLDVEIK